MTHPSHSTDLDHLRSVLAHFATGVTVITTRTADGRPVGVTANSFNSVSLDPPLVLWSIARTASAHRAFESACYWAVHILAEDQQALSSKFSRHGADRFAGLDTRAGVGGIPLLDGCAACLQCASVAHHEGGDHTILLGEVLSFAQSAGASPLVFHGGRYARLATDAATPPHATSGGSGIVVTV